MQGYYSKIISAFLVAARGSGYSVGGIAMRFQEMPITPELDDMQRAGLVWYRSVNWDAGRWDECLASSWKFYMYLEE